MLQGIGCGLASSALTAFVVDNAPASPAWLAIAVTAGSPMVGLTIGVLAAGALAAYGPAPRSLMFVLAAAAIAGCAVLIVASRETVATARGALASLRPQIRVPRSARPLLPAASAIFAATWGLGASGCPSSSPR